ncbi:MAG: sterol desaturase family protein [Bdellovibrionales bacterium]|nr:sterol desaturase family protein [Bdellovibrionales bacterium]
MSYEFIEDYSHWISAAALILLLFWETAVPFFASFFASKSERAIHCGRNVLLGLLNALMISGLFVGSWVWAAETSENIHLGFFYLLGLDGWIHACCSILLMDFWTYWWHRMNHRVAFFWRFHQVHHSDRKMDVTTSYRFHLGEIFLSSLFRTGLILLFGIKLWHLAAYEAFMFPIVMFHHANVGVPKEIDRLLRLVIVTPEMHKVHHSNFQPETDSNYTSMLSIWDRLFRSFKLSSDSHGIAFGLEGPEREHKALNEMLKAPFGS